MVGLGDVRRWNAGALDQIAATLRQRLQTLVRAGDDFTRTMPVPGWAGPASEQAAAQHKTLTTWLDQAAGGVALVGKTLTQAGDAIPAVQRAVTNAEELAGKYGFAVTEDGQVVDRYAGTTAPPELHPDDRRRAQRQVADDLGQALRTATDIDTDLASVFHRAQRGEFGADAATTTAAAAGTQDPGLTLPEPVAGATPAQNAAWWATLSPAAQAILRHDHPDWLGNLDGLPAAVRSEANLARLPTERAALTTQLAAASNRLAQDQHNPFMPEQVTQAEQADVASIEAKLRSLDVIKETAAQGNRQLLTLDTSGERAKAVVAVGDVDTAKHVAVFTPGFTTTVDRGLEKLRPSDAPTASAVADNLHEVW